MQIRFNSISVIFICLLVFIGLIINNKIEARSLSRNQRDVALQQMRLQHLAHQQKRDLLDELYDANDDKSERSKSKGEESAASESGDEDDKSERGESKGEEGTASKSGDEKNNEEKKNLVENKSDSSESQESESSESESSDKISSGSNGNADDDLFGDFEDLFERDENDKNDDIEKKK